MAKTKVAQDAGDVNVKPRVNAVLLEVSSDWIKLLEISCDRAGLSISKAYLDQMDSESVVSEKLRAAVKAQKFSTIPILGSIPRQLVNMRLLELPSIDPAEIADMIELQVGRQTPYSLQEILSGFKTVGTSRQATYTRVLLAIVQRAAVRERYYAAEEAGLTVERMGVSSEGVTNWLLHHIRAEKPKKTFLCLDVDSYFTHMIVVRDRTVIFTKSLLWGAKQADGGPEGFVNRVQEATRSCEDVLQGQHFDEVLVSGAGVARVPEMLAALETALHVPCKGIDVLSGLRVRPSAQKALTDEVKDNVSLTGVIGMALSPDSLAFHFVPDVYAMRQKILGMGRNWAGLVVGLAAMLVAASLYFTLATWRRVQYLQQLQASVEFLDPQVLQVERRIAVIRATRSRQDGQVLPEVLLPVLHASVPDGVYLDSLALQIENGRFTLSGSAPQRRDIRELIRILEETTYFTGIEEAGGTTMDNAQRFRFQINGEITRGDVL